MRRAEEEEEEKALCFLPLAPVPWVVPRGCELPWARSGARWLVKCPRPVWLCTPQSARCHSMGDM